MNEDDISRLKQARGEPCLSLSIPIDRADYQKNYELLKKSAQKARAMLRANGPSAEHRESMLATLEGYCNRLPETPGDGFGIFISPSLSLLVAYPFTVRPMVRLSDSFELRDVLYLLQYSDRYYVINLSKKGVHLFEGRFNELEEIENGAFPIRYDDEFEYERASIANSSSSSLKSFEKEKNDITTIRLKAVFRKADTLLKTRLEPGARILLAGTERMVALYKSVTSLADKIAGKVSGSYNSNTADKLRELAWEAIVRARRKEIEQQIRDLRERNAQVAKGIQQAWNAATEGKGLVLLVEKDLHRRGYRKEQGAGLYIHPPKKPYAVIPDAVENLIDTVRSKDGKVLLTENDQLIDFDRVALVLRY